MSACKHCNGTGHAPTIVFNEQAPVVRFAPDGLLCTRCNATATLAAGEVSVALIQPLVRFMREHQNCEAAR